MMVYILGIIIIVALGSIPINQTVEKDLSTHYSSDQDNRIEILFGGPRITWVTVECNITAEIHYMYQNGTWVGTQNVLLESVVATRAQYNYYGEQSTIVIEVIADEPFLAYITYTYLDTIKMSYFERILYAFGLFNE